MTEQIPGYWLPIGILLGGFTATLARYIFDRWYK